MTQILILGNPDKIHWHTCNPPPFGFYTIHISDHPCKWSVAVLKVRGQTLSLAITAVHVFPFLSWCPLRNVMLRCPKVASARAHLGLAVPRTETKLEGKNTVSIQGATNPGSLLSDTVGIDCASGF